MFITIKLKSASIKNEEQIFVVGNNQNINSWKVSILGCY